MRIAFSGTHRTGKSTLLEHVADALPGYAIVDEPYALLEEEGYECSDPPSLEDFEAQLARSIVALEEEDGPDVLFDRSPVDLLAYLLAHEDAATFDLDDWKERTRLAMQTLDLVVFVPVEETDRIALPPGERRGFRMVVHEKMSELLEGDVLGPGVEVVTVSGAVRTRVSQVLAHLGARAR